MIKKNKTNKNWAWAGMLFIGAISFGIFSCSEDDVSDDVKDVTTNSEESAWVVATLDETPNGRIMYMNVSGQLPSTIDKSEGIELGLNSSMIAHNDVVLTINNNAKTITKWSVDKNTLEISVDALLSFASTGLSYGFVAFANDQAFLYDLNEGLFIEFDLESMELMNTYNVAPLESPDYIIPGTWQAFENHGKIVIPFRYWPNECCDYSIPVYAQIAVFDPETKSVEYKTDTRSSGVTNYATRDNSGTIYLGPGRDMSFVTSFFDIDTDTYPGHLSIFRLTTDGDFDPNFEIKLDEIIPEMRVVTATSFVFDDKVAISYSDHPMENDSWDTKWTYEEYPNKSILIDVNTEEISSFTAFDDYDGVHFVGNYDGANYFNAFTWLGDRYNGKILKQNSVDDFTIVTDGESLNTYYFAKLW
ncbi:MAG: hypothetical protein AAGC64_13280 [Bacteroidota bacterium]